MEHLHKPQNHSSYTFDALENLEHLAHSDYIDTMFSNAQKMEDELNKDPSAIYKINNCIKKLDDDWMYMDQSFPVSGLAHVATGQISDGLPEYTMIKFKEADMTSQGFVALTFQVYMDDEEITLHRIALYFECEEEHIAILRENLISEIPDQTVESAEKRLLYHYMDDVKKVLDRLERYEVPENEALIMKFTDYVVDLYPFVEQQEEFKKDFETYLFSVMQLDPATRYQIDYNTTQLDDFAEPSYSRVYARPNRIAIMPAKAYDKSSPQRHNLWIDISILNETTNECTESLTLPLHALRSFKPTQISEL